MGPWGEERDRNQGGGGAAPWNSVQSVILIVNDTQAAYDELGRQSRADLYVTRQARPVLKTQSPVAAPARE